MHEKVIFKEDDTDILMWSRAKLNSRAYVPANVYMFTAQEQAAATIKYYLSLRHFFVAQVPTQYTPVYTHLKNSYTQHIKCVL